MGDNPMRVRDVLEVTMRTLGRMQITVDEVDRIGIPARDAIRNMQMCVDSIDREAAKLEELAEEPEIEIVGEEPAEDEQEQ